MGVCIWIFIGSQGSVRLLDDLGFKAFWRGSLMHNTSMACVDTIDTGYDRVGRHWACMEGFKCGIWRQALSMYNRTGCLLSCHSDTLRAYNAIIIVNQTRACNPIGSL
jgi:hypothetical protein